MEPTHAVPPISAATASWGWRARGYLRLIHPFPVAMNAVAAVAFAMLAARGWPGTRAIALIAAAIIGSQATVGIVNDLRDRDLDAVAKPEKPLIAGRATVRGAAGVGLLTLAMALGAGAALGRVSLLFVLGMTAAGLIYDLWLKRTALSFLPYIFGLPILPIWAWIAVRDAPPRLWLTYPLGVLVGFGLHLANALPDAERDRAGGIRGLVQVVGTRGALLLCLGSFALTIVAVGMLTAARRDAAVFVLIGGAAVLLLGATLSAAVRPSVGTMQRNWGVLIGCAICIAAAWLRALA
ncbi:MAG: UbiA family prenyltransferase [Thermomicrobia bacterium]|nr:UbiA family prenyltransferase [Thermomicrobia bacterium]